MSKDPKPKIHNRVIDKLKSLLAKNPELEQKLIEMLETDRYFITITFQKKYKPTDRHDLQHYYARRNFQVQDVIPSMKHLAADFTAKENPMAEIESQQWH